MKKVGQWRLESITAVFYWQTFADFQQAMDCFAGTSNAYTVI